MSDDDKLDQHVPPLLPLGHSTWAIDETALPRLIEAHRSPRGDLLTIASAVHGVAGPQAAMRRFAATAGGGQRVAGAVAVVPLCGVITPRGSFLSMLFGGGGGLMSFRDNFRSALSDSDIGAIVLDVDSPGGLVSLVPETAEEIFEARGAKPIIAVCNTMAASAAYWLASQADEVVCTPSGNAGSIGVYMVHEDWSKANEDFGVDVTYIKAGKYKAEGNMNEPLGKPGEAAWQQEVDDIYSWFLDGVAEGRGTTAEKVKAGYGEGRVLLAPRAKEAGLVDRIDTLETVVAELLGQEPDAAEDAEGAEAMTTDRLAVAIAKALRVAAEDQPRCSCGKWLEAGESECAECASKADEDDDEDDEDDDDDDDEIDGEGEPIADEDDEDEKKAAARDADAQLANILF